MVSKGRSLRARQEHTIAVRCKIAKGATGSAASQRSTRCLLAINAGGTPVPRISESKNVGSRRAPNLDLEDRRGPDLLLPARPLSTEDAPSTWRQRVCARKSSGSCRWSSRGQTQKLLTSA